MTDELREEKTRIRNELISDFTLKTESINNELILMRKKVELLGDKRLVMQKEHHNNLTNQKDEMERKLTEQRGIKGEIAEDFIGGLKKLFEDHYIDVPDDKYNVLEDQASKIEELEKKLNESIEKNVEQNSKHLRFYIHIQSK